MIPFTLTPGTRAAVPCFNGRDFYLVPVVVLRLEKGRIVAKIPSGAIGLLPRDAAVEEVSPQEWARALWRLPREERR